MATPRQHFDHWLNPLKGWFDLKSLDISAKLSANVTIDPVFEGRVVHLNDDGEFEMGVADRQMAIFLRHSSDDLDVSNDGGDIWKSSQPAGVLSGLVATGGYEIETTEFDSAQTYLPNQTLTAVASNSNATTGGRITNQSAVAYTNAVCGVVSRGVRQNLHRDNMLAFWPVYLPATP